jgi:hypothetical protein
MMRVMIFFFCIVSLRGEPLSTLQPIPQSLACRAAVNEVLRQTFKFDPAPRKITEEEDLLGDDTVRLEPFLVSEKKVSLFLSSHLEHQRELFEANKPSFANGIELLSNTRVSVGIMPYAYDGSLLPRWTLIKFRF